MPDKQNESKIMSMLERRKFVRKAGDDSPEAASDDALTNYDSDIKPIFDSSDNSMKVTPSARQPVPGILNPIFPSERPIDTTQVQPLSRESSEPATVFPSEPQKPRPDINAQSPIPPASSLVSAVQEHEPQQENYTDRYLNIGELYEALALRSKKTDSVYLIEEYLQTLPGSLPDSSRREIVGKIIAASGFDYYLLMGDGVLRVKMLKEYAERFAQHTDDYIAARQAELDDMDQRIIQTRKLIENRKELHKKQFFTIEAEAQRLKEILTFISG